MSSESNFGSKWINAQISKIKASKSLSELRKLQKVVIGEESDLNSTLRSLGNIPFEQRKIVGKRANIAKAELSRAIEQHERDLMLTTKGTFVDLSVPVSRQSIGRLHPLRETVDEMVNYFVSQGYDIAEGPEIENDWYCFEALNMPPGHAARDMQDTFYLKNGLIPRTHTSSVQVRYMESQKPPIRIIAPGKVFRNEDEDSTHTWEFYQLEGLVVTENITLADLKGTLAGFIRFLLGNDVKMRFRSNFFPYVEPAIEVDVWMDNQDGNGEWLEMLGAGMVDPQVFTNVGIDSKKYSGFAFGIGVERFAKIKYNVEDIRYFWRPDVAWLRQ